MKYDQLTQMMVPDPDDCNVGVQDFDIENVVHHPSYNSPHIYRNDIAIIKLKGKVVENGKYFSFGNRLPYFVGSFIFISKYYNMLLDPLYCFFCL